MDRETSVLEQLVDAQSDYVKGNYTSALEKFTKLIDQSKTYDYNLLIYRAYTHWRLNNAKELAGDAERASSLNAARYEANFLRAVGLFYLGKFDEAMKSIQRAKLIVSGLEASDPRRKDVKEWEKKIEIEKVRYQNLGKSTSEIKQLISASKIPYEWKQSDTHIYIDIKYVLLNKKDLKIKFDDDEVDIFFPINEERSFELFLDLFDEIVPAASTYKVLLEQIEIVLEKKNKGKHWSTLEKASSENDQVIETIGPKKIA